MGLGPVHACTMYIPKITKTCLVSAVIAASAYAQDGRPDFSEFQGDGNGMPAMVRPPADHGMTCEASEGMFGQWVQRSDCQCNVEEFKPTKHACCMRMTQNIFETAVANW